MKIGLDAEGQEIKGAHLERLEVELDGPVADRRRERGDVRGEVDVEGVTGL